MSTTVQTTRPKKKKAVSGFINPRWPKERVVRWLEIGAIPAILGLWFPDWVGSYAPDHHWHIPPLLPALPPLLTYAGALILLKACYEGIKDMGVHFKGLLASGGLCVAFAVASFVLQLFGLRYPSLISTGFAAFFAAGFFWFTTGKIAEITQEKRTKVTWHAVWILSVLSLGVYLFSVSVLSRGDEASGIWLLRAGVALFTITFLFCRYAVHCYKTQTSIGARFKESPDEQFWTRAEQ